MKNLSFLTFYKRRHILSTPAQQDCIADIAFQFKVSSSFSTSYNKIKPPEF
jgi:hypothetical protein